MPASGVGKHAHCADVACERHIVKVCVVIVNIYRSNGVIMVFPRKELMVGRSGR
jgi:hypothetical protein